MKPARYIKEFLFYAAAMVLAFTAFLNIPIPARGLTVSAPAAPSWCGYELFMASGLLTTNWVDLCPVFGTNSVTTSPAGQPPTFFRAQYNQFKVPLAWNGNGGSGFKVYFGTASGLYTQCFDAGTNLAFLFPITNAPAVMFFAVTAYENVDGNYLESDYSNEVVVSNNLTLVIQ